MRAVPHKLPKGPSLERRSRRSHEAVLASAEALLAERGYASITIDQIAARAGVGKATIYRWWPSKAAIFMEVYTLLAASAQHNVDTGSLALDLQKQVRGAFRLFRETVAGLALAGFVAEGQSNPEIATLLRESFANQRREINAAIIRRAISRGEVGDVSAEVVSEMITGALYYAVLIGRSAFSDRQADEFVRTILHGILGSATKRTTRLRASVLQQPVQPQLRLQ